MAFNSQQQGYGAFGGNPNPSAPPYGGGYPQQGGYPPPGGFPQQGGYPPPGGFPQQGGYSQQGPPPAGFAGPGAGYPQGGFPPPPPHIGHFIDPEFKSDVNEFTFSDKSIRMAFIRKVYAILMVQLLVTFGFVALFVMNEDVKLWTRANPGIFYGALALNFGCIIALACCEGVRRKAPGNFICLAIFTIAEGFMIGTFSSAFKAESVLLAVGVTAAVCLALTIFSFQTKWDFTAMGGVLFVALIVFMLFGILTIFLPKTTFPTLHIVYACLGALLFSFYLVYDTQLMLGGKHKCSISPEEYIFAALNLYLDIINIFIYILSILGSRD
ncbi:Protein lifeguard 1 [Orchesella cincta]|uniref:Protein lifeguard 1 n=1 Tax=Orchesella cincta TaxID=48709 RepID=A0A1D2MCA3_ORCCI|nr:Protein lifeguard 1 [Orchesella cincta]